MLWFTGGLSCNGEGVALPLRLGPFRSATFGGAKALLRKPFARNVAWVASGTAGAQAISMAFAPFITRIYGPEAYGLLGVFMATVSIAAPVAALAYPHAIVLPKQENGARAVVQLSIIITAAVAGAVLVGLCLSGDTLLAALGAADIKQFSLLIPIAMMLTAYQEIGQQWLVRKRAFQATARVSVARSLIVGSAKIIVGVFHPIAAALVGLHTTGIAIQSMLQWFEARRLPKSSIHTRRWLGWGRLTSVAQRYWDFPVYRAPQILINAASHALPVLLLGALFGPAAAGFYALGRNVLGAPAGLVARAVSMVFYPRITEAARNGEDKRKLILVATAGLTVVGIVPFGVIFLAGPSLFAWVFGSEWGMAGNFARWLSLMYFMHFINGPSVAAVPVLGMQRGLLVYELFSTGAKVAALYVGFSMSDNSGFAVALFAGAGAIAYLFLITWIIRSAGVRDRSVLT